MDQAFRVHMLSELGKENAKKIASDFDHLLTELRKVCPEGRCLSIAVTKLEEACFFAKKAMASDPRNCE